MTSANDFAGPPTIDALALLERGKTETVPTTEFAQTAHTLITERARLMMSGNESEGVAEALNRMARVALDVQCVIAARATRRTLPQIASVDLNATFGDHTEECAQSDEHFHLNPILLDDTGETLALNDAEREAFGHVLNVFSLADMTIVRVLAETTQHLDVGGLNAIYTQPDEDPFFDGPTEVDLEMAKPNALNRAMLDDDIAARFVVARLRNIHDRPIPEEVLDRAIRSFRTNWVHTGTDENMKSAIMLSEVKFARIAQERFPTLHALSVSVNADGDFRFQAMGDEGYDPEAATALFHEVVLSAGGVTMFARRHQWETYFEIRERAGLAPTV